MCRKWIVGERSAHDVLMSRHISIREVNFYYRCGVRIACDDSDTDDEKTKRMKNYGFKIFTSG